MLAGWLAGRPTRSLTPHSHLCADCLRCSYLTLDASLVGDEKEKDSSAADRDRESRERDREREAKGPLSPQERERAERAERENAKKPRKFRLGDDDPLFKRIRGMAFGAVTHVLFCLSVYFGAQCGLLGNVDMSRHRALQMCV